MFSFFVSSLKMDLPEDGVQAAIIRKRKKWLENPNLEMPASTRYRQDAQSREADREEFLASIDSTVSTVEEKYQSIS